MLSVEEYQKVMKDKVSSDKLILKRLNYLEAFCGNIIRLELEKYLSANKDKKMHAKAKNL